MSYSVTHSPQVFLTRHLSENLPTPLLIETMNERNYFKLFENARISLDFLFTLGNLNILLQKKFF